MNASTRLRFGAEVERLRRAAVPTLTVAAFLTRSGLTAATLSKIERGRPSWKPTTEAIAALAIALGCSTEERRDLFRLAGLVDPALIAAWSKVPDVSQERVRAALYDGVARAGAGMLGESQAVQEACLLAVEILTTHPGARL